VFIYQNRFPDTLLEIQGLIYQHQLFDVLRTAVIYL
jgi:hypothetical protein